MKEIKMAKKDESKKVEVKAENAKPEAEKQAEESEKGIEDKALEGEAVKCVALLVTLRNTHPQASYGRCGYRFNKTEAVRIPMADLPEEAIAVLDSDPYLECEYECE